MSRSSARARARRAHLVLAAGAGLLAAGCTEPPPRSYADFMEDRIAREGTLARCNAQREESVNDMECANARRAAAVVALEEERRKREVFERESQRKLEELRRRMAEREQAEAEAAAAAAAEAEAAYEAQWADGSETAPLPAPEAIETGVTHAAPPRGLSFIELPASVRSIER